MSGYTGTPRTESGFVLDSAPSLEGTFEFNFAKPAIFAPLTNNNINNDNTYNNGKKKNMKKDFIYITLFEIYIYKLL